jgi:hypothetical protein
VTRASGRAASTANDRLPVPCNLGDGVVGLLTGAGFGDAREVERVDHRFGPVTFVQATRH